MSWARRVVPAAGLLATGAAALRPIDDLDFWWLLRGGQYIVETRTIPAADPFSATAHGAEWLNHAWGFEVLLYAVYAAGGFPAVILLQGAFAAATFAVLYALLRRQGLGWPPALGLVALASLATWEFWAPRPQLPTYLLLAVFGLVLADYQEGRAHRLRWLPLLMVPWANLHGGFLAGPGLIALAAGGEALDWALTGGRPGRASLERARTLAVTAGASLAACVVNPFHVRALAFPLHVMGERVSQAWIAEWASPPFGHPQVWLLEAMFVLALLLPLAATRPLPWRDVAILVPLVHLALQSIRNTPIFVIGAMPVLGRALRAWALPAWSTLGVPARLAAGAAAVVALTLGSALAAGSMEPGRVWQTLRPGLGAGGRFPEAAVDYLRRSGGSGPILNEYDWGGYLIWHLYPRYRVVIDGRAAVYGPVRFRSHMALTELEPGWEAILADLAPTVALLQTDSVLARALRSAGWRVLHEDPRAVVLAPPGAPA